MAGITLAKAMEAFRRDLGNITDRDELIDMVTSSIEFVLFNGGGEILREWCVIARNGKFTFPRDLETPIKFKFSRLPNTGFGTIHSPYFSYSANAIKDCSSYLDWDVSIEVKANRAFSQFEPPSQGLRILLTTRNPDDVGKKVMVAGKRHGKEIAPIHEGFKTAGELLTIYLESDPQKKYSSFIFDEITGVVKDITCDWIMLSGITNDLKATPYFLSYYHPDEEIPTYQQGEVFAWQNSNCDILMNILGRINPSVKYSRDEDIIPITSFEMLKYLAKRYKYEEGGDLAEVATMEQRIKNLIKVQVAYQQKAARSLSFGLKGSGCTLSNV